MKSTIAISMRAGSLARLFVLCAVLAGCGGGDDTDVDTSSREQRADETAQATFFPGNPIPADAGTKGMWSSVYAWPLIPIHALLLPDGRVLTYGTDGVGKQTGYFTYDLWDGVSAPNQGHLTLPNTTATDIFCSSQLLLPQTSGSVFLAGGDNWTGTATTNTGNNNTTVFESAGNTLTRGPNMNRPRWYSTATTLVNGEIFIQGGAGGTDRAEIRGLDGSFRLFGPSTASLDYYYPRNFVAPDGRVFGFESNGKMYYANVAGGTLTQVGQLDAAYTGFASSAAMFRPGRILQIGGTNSNGAVVIDITSGTPVVTPTQSLSQQRIWVTGTLLADGKVLATGGSPIGNWYGGANNIAEIWDPQTGAWSRGAAGALARLYHSTALLMPDASVMVGGGGAPGPLTNTNVEIYYPPYFFTAQGTRAARPVITAAPTNLAIGKTFSIGVGNTAGVSRVTLVKTGSVTHSFNMEQRFLDLTFNATGTSVAVQAPTRAADATPGFYMLFVFDAAGVPSVAKIVKLGIAADPNPAVAPTVTTPANQNATVGTAASLQLVASDPNGDALQFAATGLPPGLTVNAASGLISGSPTAAGTYNAAVTVTDGVNVASANFVWTVAALNAAPLVIDSVTQPVATLADGNVTYTASATGVNPRYRWSFGDDSAETAWSSAASVSHVFTRPGTFYVTLSVTDDRNVVQTRTFLQVVGLPLTARKPTTSTTVLVETPAAGNPRVWAINADNDSVSVFDATTRAKLAEIPTGLAPRSLARAPNGMIWVANKQAPSISIIDPATRTVVRTLWMARASMPYGIAMSPTANQAFVALEATGQVLKFDTTSYAQLAAASVGPNPRHLSVSADGASVYVSRYITPPLPGESTATVATAGEVGGEVVVLNATNLATTRTIVLRHSDKPDFENQGRGIPNYLGAAVISPDGTQAWVPSKQDNIKRGSLRDGAALNFQSTVRAISSRIVTATGQEDLSLRVDHDNASLASAAVYDPRGVYLFVALETSREVAVVDAHAGTQLLRFDVGRAPQGLALSADGNTLYVHNFMDRTLGVYDLQPLLTRGELTVPALATLSTVATDKLVANVLLGKRLFYDARDTRLSRDRYMSCASCHNDGGQDGRVWDLTGQGEGLRNTVNLRGRPGLNGFLHWSANFDEVQDFEGQIRALAGGTGLMSDAAFTAGTRSQPLGDRKTGLSTDLDALAAYVNSLGTVDVSPFRPSATTLSSAATQGRALFQSLNCAACHSGTTFTGSGQNTRVNIGTIKPSSGTRLGAALTGIDIPTLRDVWATAPYLHDGSAATLGAAVRAHQGVSITDANLASLVAYLREIGRDELSAPQSPGTGTGLAGTYFNSVDLSGSAVLNRVENVDFNWGAGKPADAVTADRFSVRWSGTIEAPATGTYWFQTVSDEGVRVRINGSTLINNWGAHLSTANMSASLNLVAGTRVPIVVEYYENSGPAEIHLQWRTPGFSGFASVPADRLFAN